jgi:hypothetical protein
MDSEKRGTAGISRVARRRKGKGLMRQARALAATSTDDTRARADGQGPYEETSAHAGGEKEDLTTQRGIWSSGPKAASRPKLRLLTFSFSFLIFLFSNLYFKLEFISLEFISGLNIYTQHEPKFNSFIYLVYSIFFPFSQILEFPFPIQSSHLGFNSIPNICFELQLFKF